MRKQVLGGLGLGFVCIGSLCVALSVCGLAVGRTAIASTTEAAAVTKIDVKQWLSIAGIDSESLTAAGVSPGSVAGVLAHAKSYLNDHLDELRAAQRAAAVAADKASKPPAEGTTAESLRAEADAARAAKDAAVDAFFTATLADQSQNTRQSIATLNANRSRGVPTKYLVVNRTEDQWAALRNALAALRTSTGEGDSASNAQSVIQAADSDPAVVAADQALSTQLPSVTAAWSQSLAAL